MTDTLTSTTLVVDTRTVVLTGSCVMCGKCCVELMKDNVMTDDGKCRYLLPADKDGHRLCKIQAAVEADDQKYLDSLSAEQLAYWKANCEGWPKSALTNDPIPKETLNAYIRKGIPYPECGFGFEVS